ncbi:diguanylate cyclase [Guyparkeria halophila]|uniref:Diguanylate cyclase n=1 Tax=Guyparkeria halophila TaxID=47960 RepID=A0A6I6CWY1_9GAMM|nr:diguanylate cyclase [Guyparkeria halophila]QGT78669.1 diguanylate cyclase [Guyparkeria halophila]
MGSLHTGRRAENQDMPGPFRGGSRPRYARLKRMLPSLVAGLVVSGVLLASTWVVERQLTTAVLQADLDDLAQIRTRIESQLNQASNVSDGVGAMIEVNHGLDVDSLRSVADRMLERTPVIRSIAIAPDNVIQISIPLEGNEAAIGVDLAAHPIQGTSLRRAMQTGEPVLGGPYELVQGGYAVIHRVPVFFDTDGDGAEEYWGVVSTPIDVMRLFESAGVSDRLNEGSLAVRGMDGLGADGAVFLGQPELFAEGDVLTTPVIALDGRWQLAMQPSQPPAMVTWLTRAAELLAVLVGLLVIWLAVRWQAQQRSLVDSERLLRDVTSNVSDVVFRTDRRGQLVYVSPAYERMVGRSEQGVIGASWLNLFPEEERRRIREAAERMRGRGHAGTGQSRLERVVLTTRLVRNDGTEVPAEVRVEPVATAAQGQSGLVGTLTDLSDRQAFEQLEGLATAVFEGAGDAIVILDRFRHVLAVNPAFERLVGQSSKELVGARLTTPEVLDHSRRRLEACVRGLRQRGRWTEELACRLPDGRERVLGWSVDLIRDDRRRVSRYVAVISDVTVRHRRMQAMHHRALHDPLTDTLNRSGLEERFEQARLHAIREGTGIALAFVDLNGFKPINDTLGHHVGDEVLREVSRRLSGVGRREDIVARLGGDEFVVAFYGVRNDADMVRLGDALLEALREPMVLGGTAQLIHVQASIGFARFPDDADTLDGLMRRADAAMYRAKEKRDDTVVFHRDLVAASDSTDHE